MDFNKENVILFFIDNLKELPTGNGKAKLKAECSLEEFINKFNKTFEDEE